MGGCTGMGSDVLQQSTLYIHITDLNEVLDT